MTLTPPPPPPGQPGSPEAAAPGPSVGPGGSLPRPLTVLAAEYRLLLRSIATRGRLAAIGALAAVSLLTSILVSLAPLDDPLRSATNFVNLDLTTLVPVAVLVFGAATLGDLVDDATLVYLWLRPVPAWVHVAAAWLATVTITVPLVGAPVLLSAAIIEPDPDLLLATVIGGSVAIAAYSALFVMAGIRFRRALPWGLVYILIWEGFVASAGETAARLAVRSYVRSILSELTGQELRLAEFDLASGIVVPLVAGVLALAYASRRLARTDVA